MTPLEILYQDEDLIAINKPPAIMVHKTGITEDKIFLLQLLRDQIKQRVYPVHRLDRPTTGVLLFAKNKETASNLNADFRERKIHKEYQAIVRGYLPPNGVIDYPLSNKEKGEAQEAITHFETLETFEYPVPIGRYETARYSYVHLTPLTGKRHQIRRHLAHLRHPIINDKRYGDIHHNRYFKEKQHIPFLLLHAQTISFQRNR